MFPGAMDNPGVTQQSSLYEPQQTFHAQAPWISNNSYGSYQLPLQLSQYYNVFPDVPSTKTSWTFPNGCVTSNIVRFTGLPTPTYPIGSSQQLDQCKASGLAPLKRKSVISENETLPSKMFITEDKMAARMNQMHISNNFMAYNNNNNNNNNNNPPILDESLMDDEIPVASDKLNAHPQFVVCDELKNLSKDFISIIPEPLVPLEKPNSALVLWKPPMSYLKVVKVQDDEEYNNRSSVVITDITDRPDLDNNNISSIDLNIPNHPCIEYPPDVVDSMELS